MVAWTGLIWLGIRTGGGLLWMQWTVGFQKMKGISRLAKDLFASQEAFCSTEWVGELVNCIFIRHSSWTKHSVQRSNEKSLRIHHKQYVLTKQHLLSSCLWYNRWPVTRYKYLNTGTKLTKQTTPAQTINTNEPTLRSCLQPGGLKLLLCHRYEPSYSPMHF